MLLQSCLMSVRTCSSVHFSCFLAVLSAIVPTWQTVPSSSIQLLVLTICRRLPCLFYFPHFLGKVHSKEILRFHSPLLQRVAFVDTMVFHSCSLENCTFLVGSDRQILTICHVLLIETLCDLWASTHHMSG